MRKIFYGAGIFLVVAIFTLGFYGSYRISQLRGQVRELKAVQREYQALEAENQTLDAGFYLKNDNGKVHVYRGDGETVYEYTNIQVSSLPEAVQQEIEQGKFIKSEVELYSFLENYSS
ncbi:MAG: hypothetical protein HFH60_04905 [Lachnospiraceae bacterium]|nr:hypothetical protein [Lachnospiraceae bacterium]